MFFLKIFCLIFFITFNFICLQAIADEAETTPPITPTEQDNSINEEFMVLPVGLNVGTRNVIPSGLVKGLEDGTQAIDFENWLIPFSDVVTALKLQVNKQEDGFWQITAPGLVTRIDSGELITDAELGLTISVQQIQTWFQVPTEFDVLEYAVVFNPPWSNIQQTNIAEEIPIITEGLPTVFPAPFTFTAIGNDVNINGTKRKNSLNNEPPRYQGELLGTGTLLGGSWFVRTRQGDLFDTTSWNLQEAQWWHQGQSTDYIIGSQPTFWPRDNGGDYWGLTTIKRWDVEPRENSFSGFDPRQRFQPEQIQRTITGQTAPGTLVRLVKEFSDRIVAETLVDGSGVYTFKVPVKRERYQVFLYRDGLLFTEPEIRDVNFTDLPELLTAGTSVLNISGGFKRDIQAQNFIGEFNQLEAGIAYRHGVSEDLTVGTGVYYDGSSLRPLGEIFYQPKKVPFQLAISALTPDFDDSDWSIESRMYFNPTPDFSLNFNGNYNSQKLDLNWRISPNFNFVGSANQSNSDSYLAAALQFNHSKGLNSTYARVEVNSNSRLTWNLSQTFGNLRLEHRRGRNETESQITYNLSNKTSFLEGHSLIFDYDTTTQNGQDDYLAALGWRYRSDRKLNDGFPVWEFNLGYSIGSRGSGVLSSVSTAIIPGVIVRLGYQQVSLYSPDAQFRIEFSPKLNVQNGIRSGPSPQDFNRLRSNGGIWIKPFYDRNNNGKLDKNEDIFTEDANLMLILNNQTINYSYPEIKPDGVFLSTPPGVYRLDLDPAGFPLDWTSGISALAVKVAPGSYTEVLIPFSASYTVSGVVTNAEGKALNGIRVEAISQNKDETIFSLTNGAGVFYLEGMKQGIYNLKLNGEPAQPEQIIIQEDSETFQEINLLKN